LRIQRKSIMPGQMIPPFYGISYIDWEKNEAVCHPVGINLIVLFWHDFKMWIRNPKGRL